ncbi:dihydrolipoamide acetyltransferase family protein [Streptomyces sp. DSM 44917]|uniref:Dihydrolipoamide acetyltransferase component of pyruvate dehydrogenase complex n=1 Tax=Streptomyces boetiae TaxID=3075541 RepID=A0ABU2L6C4_9ACTN|nr:dihydrolipoamide acetyltransferase family protein [Streptomyces sp. DSM 44917]MDT0307113.1 dihydrolipoamide acetyltransferase family protein [Streptomyces sp. DSM 44917]
MTMTTQRYREFRMPDVGEGLTEAEILKWLVRPGDAVSDGQVVVEVETAKAAVELPIPYDGLVRELLFEEGATVDVGTPIITIDTAPSAGGEAPADSDSGDGPAARQPVLVGYGVSPQQTRRRPRKSPPGAPADGGPAAGAGSPAQPGSPAGAGAPGGAAPEANAGAAGPGRAAQTGADAAPGGGLPAGSPSGASAPPPANAGPGSGAPGPGYAAQTGAGVGGAGHGAARAVPGGAALGTGPGANAPGDAPAVGSPAVGYGPAQAGAPAAGAGLAPAGGRAGVGNGSAVQAGVPGVAGRNGAAVRGGGAVLAKPPVRKMAKDLGIDLATVAPTGAGGIVTREDVQAAAEARAAATDVPPAPQVTQAPATDVPPVAPAPQAMAPQATVPGERREPVKGVRKATAQAMVESAFTAPHVTEFVTVDVTRTVRLVERLRKDPDLAGLRVNPLLIVARALLIAIRRNPGVNAAWDEENQEIVHKDYINLGIAAATPRGLIVPNIKDAGSKSLPELSRALADLVATAKEGRTSLADMRGGTVTITNIGVFGIDAGTPILTPGESAILAFGAIREQPWVHKGKVVPRHVTTLALSFDHRLVDGELGSRVLRDVADILERPRRLLTWG